MIWSHAWAANYAVLELIQKAGITKFAAVKPQRWVVASFEHHCGPHGVQLPHVHNVVLTALTTGPSSEQDGCRGRRALADLRQLLPAYWRSAGGVTNQPLPGTRRIRPSSASTWMAFVAVALAMP